MSWVLMVHAAQYSGPKKNKGGLYTHLIMDTGIASVTQSPKAYQPKGKMCVKVKSSLTNHLQSTFNNYSCNAVKASFLLLYMI